jgi:hypothetical protein
LQGECRNQCQDKTNTAHFSQMPFLHLR